MEKQAELILGLSREDDKSLSESHLSHVSEMLKIKIGGDVKFR